LEKLAERLGLTPEVGWLVEVIHIIIEGVHIEHEISAALTAWAEGNWPAAGYNVAMLAKTLVFDLDAQRAALKQAETVVV